MSTAFHLDTYTPYFAVHYSLRLEIRCGPSILSNPETRLILETGNQPLDFAIFTESRAVAGLVTLASQHRHRNEPSVIRGEKGRGSPKDGQTIG